MHRFYLPPERTLGPSLKLAGGEAHHALRVLRLRPGDRVTVLDGAGGEWFCEIERSGRQEVGLRVLDKRSHPAQACRITLVQAIPKGKCFDCIIEKATELGAARVAPLLTERVVVRLEGKEIAGKLAKWRAVAIEAIKQCGTPWLPEICAPQTLSEVLAGREQSGFDLSLMGCLQPDSPHPRKYFEQFKSAHGRPPHSVSLWIGPEGDFTPAEYDILKQSGVKPMSFGPLVLRADTAAVYGLSILNYEMSL